MQAVQTLITLLEEQSVQGLHCLLLHLHLLETFLCYKTNFLEFEPCSEKTGLQGFCPVPTQTRLYSTIALA